MIFESYKREMACFLVPRHGVLSITTNNTASSVDFDWREIWPVLKKIEAPYVCMIHTHPPSKPRMSSTDENMVYGWVQAIGKPIYYIIISNGGIIVYLCQQNAEDHNKVDRIRIYAKISDGIRQVISFIWSMSFEVEDVTTYPDLVKWFNEAYKPTAFDIEFIEEKIEEVNP